MGERPRGRPAVAAAGIHTHAITSHYALPLLIKSPGGLVIEMTDGTDDYNADHYRVSFFYDVAKGAVSRMAFALAHELDQYDATAVLLTPGWLRSEAMLDGFGVTEANWRDATERIPHFAISESPSYVGRAVAALAADPDVRAVERQVHVQRRTRPALRLHRPRRQPPGRLALHRRGAGPRQTRRHHRLPLTPTAVRRAHHIAGARRGDRPSITGQCRVRMRWPRAGSRERPPSRAPPVATSRPLPDPARTHR